MSKECNCGSVRSHALAVSSAVFQALLNAQANPDREESWRKHADLLEQKFTTGHGRHYSYFIPPLGVEKDLKP